jgi:predicted lipoprotein
VLGVDTTSRSGVERLDLEPYDGAPDAELQIGPVIRGTALRDALPFIHFDDFTNQMEYASVSRVLHERIVDSVLARVDRASLTGQVIQFYGAYAQAAGTPLVTPVILRVGGGG